VPHISLNNLSISYGNHKVLHEVSVDIPDSQITVIIGPSGCGKTTLLKSLNRLLDLNDDVSVKGNVLIDGVNTYDPKADVLSLRKKLGFLSQRPYPLPMSIYDNIAFGPKVHRLTQEQIVQQIRDLEGRSFQVPERKNGAMDVLVESYLRLAGLWDEVKDRLRTPASRLSIGQQQRLALARALAVEPEAILADEPTSAWIPCRLSSLKSSLSSSGIITRSWSLPTYSARREGSRIMLYSSTWANWLNTGPPSLFSSRPGTNGHGPI
jgi:phosphate transport system ATP-binding protein